MKINKDIWEQENAYISMVMEQLKSTLLTSQNKVIEQRSALKEINKNMLSEFKFETESMVDLEGAAIMTQYQTMGKNVENAMDYQIERSRELVKLQENAYFAKISFQEDGDVEEDVYIGSASLIKEGKFNYLIYDWRAPICSIFYDYEAGAVAYEAPGGTVSGKLLGKRHFKIAKGKIIYMFDSNVNIMDDMLKEALAKSVDDKMKTIITTIQKEQNQVIRDESSDVLVVSGSAGSGKTSIALHRIAYLLYRNRQTVIPSDILIFTPNDIFSDYISHVLPELGEKNVDSITFNDYLQSILGIYLPVKEEDSSSQTTKSDYDDDEEGYSTRQKAIPTYTQGEQEEVVERIDPIEEKILKCRWEKIESYYEQMEYLLSPHQNSAYMTRVQSIIRKSSTEFIAAFDEYIDGLENNAEFFEDIYFQDHLILSREEMMSSYLDCVGIIKCSSRLLQTRNRVMEKMNDIKRAAAYSYEQQLINGDDYYTKSDIKQKTRKFVKLAFRPLRRQIMEMTSLDMLELYNFFLKNQGLKPIGKNLSFEDALCLMYMKGRLDTIKEVNKIKYLVIDEAQDYTLLHYKIIKLIFGHCKYTLLGDPNQAMHPYLSSHVTGDVEDFLGENPKHIRLTKTYRSTEEINRFCRSIIPETAPGENILRNGKEPEVIKVEGIFQEIVISLVIDALKAGNRSIAVIGKTKKHCEGLYQQLSDYCRANETVWDNNPLVLGLLNDEDQYYKTGVIVIPSYLAKGLEFDCVVVVTDDVYTYGEERERQLFYTVCSRALHELTIVYEKIKPKLLP